MIYILIIDYLKNERNAYVQISGLFRFEGKNTDQFTYWIVKKDILNVIGKKTVTR